MRSILTTALALVASANLMSGCSNVGVDNVVFVTRTNVAVDFDATPPTASIGYKRDELVLEPRDENGRVLPVLTTVSTSAKPLEFGANHSFATGDAAIVMSKYLTSNAQLDAVTNPTISLTTLVTALDSGLPGNEISKTGRERIVFKTNTSLGLEVDWNASAYPNAIALGYKRKEFAYVPLAESRTKPGKLHLTSLLATAAGASQIGSREESGIVIGQTFATGLAATLMASHPAVRRALGPAIVPNYEKIREEQQRRILAYNKSLNNQEGFAQEINTLFNALSPPKKDAVIAEAKRHKIWEDAVAESVTHDNFESRIVGAIDPPDIARTGQLQLLLMFTKTQ